MTDRIITYTIGSLVTSAPADLWNLAGFGSFANSTEAHYVPSYGADPRKRLALALSKGLRNDDAVLNAIAQAEEERTGDGARRAELKAAADRNAAAQAELRAEQIRSAREKRALKSA